ncbi:response regulator [Sphingoaurantiacus capsulatus]|uniref:Response regulator n=1 Tax=Sphingoaurantiacus capsulatus TaxID=1771310 RepID=A0ABV7XAQ9_9SPHN
MLQQYSSNKSPAEGPPTTSDLPAGGPVILVVDDDAGMRTALSKILRANGFRALTAANHHEMAERLATDPVDMILLDVMMPGRGGFDICRDLRQVDGSDTPVIMISARGEEADRVAGLELGADDYIAKPFGRSELLARIRAVLRRGRLTGEAEVRRAERLNFRDWTVDLRRRELYAGSGARIDLSGAEYDLLIALLENAQNVIGREALLELSRARLAGSSDRSVDVLVCRLRRKLGDDEARELIRTVRGVGYIFVEPVTRA